MEVSCSESSQPAPVIGTAARKVTNDRDIAHLSSPRGDLDQPSTQDSFQMLAALDALFPRLADEGTRRRGGLRVWMLGVTLAEIVPTGGEQGSLFEHLDPEDSLAREARGLAPSRAMDRINERFGRHAASSGPLGAGRIDRVGTKIAFGRIPDRDEFHE